MTVCAPDTGSIRGQPPSVYTGAMRRSVYRMKADNRRDYLDFYAVLMAEVLQKHLHIWQPELLIPVPMHWKNAAEAGL